MLCKKCGKDIADNAKFCGYCGNPVENESSYNEVSKEETIIMNEGNNLESINNVLGQNLNSVNDIYKNTNIDFNNSNNNENSVKTKKNKNIIFIIIGVLLALICIVLVFIAINKTEKGTINSMKVLENTLMNFNEKSKNSGGFKANLNYKSQTGDSLNLNASFKYLKKDDTYDLAFNIDKNIITDEINIYSRINRSQVSLFAKSSVIDLLGMTESNEDMWVYYNYIFDESLDELFEDDTNYDIDLEGLIDEKHFFYVDKLNDLNHYKLVIDNELMSKVEDILAEEENGLNDEIDSYEDLDTTFNLDVPIEIDFYITKSNELKSVSIDLTKLINDENVLSATMTLEFSDFDSLTQVIPDDALNSSINIDDYMNEYYKEDSSNEYNDTYDYNYDDEYDYNEA